ncbi:MAG: ABC transporter ATP-binding protein [Thermoleophilaceae bacterium]
MSTGLAPGEIVLEKATRTFRVRRDRSCTLKELVVRRGSGATHAAVQALREVSLRIAPGEAVGLVGRNGAGKSSTLACLAGIVPLDSGRAQCGGRVITLLELGAGFGPDFSGRENIYLNGALHGFGREEIAERIEDIVAFSELGEFIDLPVKVYSSGMFLRLGFSIAAHLDADVMLIDEILAVGDESFQRKCFARIAQRMEAGATLVLVSHDPGAIERVCRRVVVLDGGRVTFDGEVTEGLLHYHRLLGTEDGASRSSRPAGGGPALEVAELELLDADGHPRSAYRPGEALAVHMRLRARSEAERAVAALEVRSERGELCFRTDTALGTVEGEIEVSFEVPRLALLEGSYDVAVGAHAQDAPAGRLLDRLTRLVVSRAEGGEGIADLRGSWTVAGRSTQEEALR